MNPNNNNNKLECAKTYGLQLIDGADEQGFSTTPGLIHYGANSGFQAVNLAIQFGARYIVLIGFDMREVNGRNTSSVHIRRSGSRPRSHRSSPIQHRCEADAAGCADRQRNTWQCLEVFRNHIAGGCA